MKMPRELGPVHFIGIGGIGMSGIAEVLHNLGYKVQGSDAADSANVQRLRDKGIAVLRSATTPRISAMRKSSSSRPRSSATIPELMAAREKRLPVVRRAEMLAELMRFKQRVAIAGTHGKTTTTSMVATLLDAGGLDPTVINGGIINAYGTNARMGEGEWMVVEADEMRRHLPQAARRHRDRHQYRSRASRPFRAPSTRSSEAFRHFVENVPFYGFAVMCTRPSRGAGAGRAHRGPPRHHLWRKSAGRCALDRCRPHGRRDVAFSTCVIRDRMTGTRRIDRRSASADAGPSQCARTRRAAIAVAHELGMPAERIRRALSRFGGVKRRFTRTGDMERRRRLRRLRPPSGRDRGGAAAPRATRPRAR